MIVRPELYSYFFGELLYEGFIVHIKGGVFNSLSKLVRYDKYETHTLREELL
jgi:hypothetical protein